MSAPRDSIQKEKKDDTVYPPDHWYGLVVAGCLFFAQFSIFGCINSFSVFQDAMKNDPTLQTPGYTRVSFVPAVANFLATIVAVIIGPISDRYGPRRLYIASSFMLFIGLFASSYIENYYGFAFVFSVFCGASSGFIVAPGLSALGGWFDKHRVLAVGLGMMGGGVGSGAVPVMTSTIFDHYNQTDWRLTLRWMSLLSILVFLSGIPIRPRVYASEETLQDASFQMSVYAKKTYLTKTFFVLWLTTMCNGYAFFATLYYIIPYATAQGDPEKVQYQSYDRISIGSASTLMTLYGIASCFGNILIGPVTRRAGLMRPYAISQVLTGASIIVMPYVHTYAGLSVVCLGFGLFSGAALTCMPGVAADRYLGPRLGSAIGVMYTGFGVGGLLGPTVTGDIIDASGGLFDVAFGVVGGLVIVSAFLVTFVLDPPPSSSDPAREQIVSATTYGGNDEEGKS